jgi:hypothetical protein
MNAAIATIALLVFKVSSWLEIPKNTFFTVQGQRHTEIFCDLHGLCKPLKYIRYWRKYCKTAIWQEKSHFHHHTLWLTPPHWHTGLCTTLILSDTIIEDISDIWAFKSSKSNGWFSSYNNFSEYTFRIHFDTLPVSQKFLIWFQVSRYHFPTHKKNCTKIFWKKIQSLQPIVFCCRTLQSIWNSVRSFCFIIFIILNVLSNEITKVAARYNIAKEKNKRSIDLVLQKLY